MNISNEYKNRTYKAIIFDVGDTLLEHYPGQVQIYCERLKVLGFELDTSDINKVSVKTTTSTRD